MRVGVEGSVWPAVLDPIISPGIGLDDPVIIPSPGVENHPRVAYGGGIYLVVWSAFNGLDYDVQATRVRASDGAVLDMIGIPHAIGSNSQEGAAVASDGSDFLVTWHEVVVVGKTDTNVYGIRVRGSDGQMLDSSPLLISGASNPQSTPSVAFGGGNYFVVWEDGRNSSLDIYGARVRASDGVVLDPSGIPVSTAALNQSSAVVAVDGSNFLVAWSDGRDGSGDIYGARVGGDGVVLDPSGIPISTATGDQSDPDIAFTEGTFLVTWSDPRDGQSDVYASRLRASDGAVLDASGIPVATGAMTQLASSIVSDESHFLVVWEDSTGSSSHDVYGARIGTNGEVLDTTPVALAASVSNLEEMPAVALDGSHFLLVWLGLQGSRPDIRAQRVRASDLAVLDTPPMLLSTTLNSELGPVVAAGANSYLVAWADTRGADGNYDIYGVRVRASDGAVLDSTAIPIASLPGSQGSAAVAFDGSNFLVAWSTYRDGSSSGLDIFGARVRESDGVVLDPSGFPISTAPQDQSAPVVAYGEGVYFVTWSDSRAGSNADVYGARVRASDGVVLDPEGIAVSTVPELQTHVATAFGGGSFLVAWSDWRNGATNTDIYGARVRASDGAVLDPAGLALTNATRSQHSPVVAFDGSNFLAVWQDPRGSSVDLYGTRVRASDGAVLDSGGLALCTDASGQETPGLAFDGVNYLMVWRDTRSGVSRLNGSRVLPDGSVLDGSGFLMADGPEFPLGTMKPSVASWGRGRFLAAYTSRHGDDAGNIRFRIKVWLVSDPVNGARCTSGAECTSGYCVDGVCCGSACAGGTCGGGICVPPLPQITCPGGVVAEATSASGATVNYPTAVASGEEPLSVTYSQDSGTPFALGTTAITATVTDGSGRTESCTFTLTVRDTTAPTLSCPEDLQVRNAPSVGMAVEYPPASASDAVSTPVVSYSHASGELFPLEKTSVTVTATDAAGNSATCSFQVRVDPSVSVPAPSGCESGAGSGTPMGLGWGALVLLAWSASLYTRKRAEGLRAAGGGVSTFQEDRHEDHQSPVV